MRVIKLAVSLLILLGLGFCLFVNFVNAPAKGETDDANRHSADQIAAALRTYHAQEGVFPTTLAELVPAFLPQLPQQRSGADFSYQATEDGTDFRLAYPEAPIGTLPADAEYELKASTGEWRHVVY